MNRLCCSGLALGTRIIGTYTMSVSILMINVLMSNFFAREKDEDFFDTIENWALLGLNWAQILRNSQLPRKAQTAMVCFLIYSMLFLLASAYLALGSISRKPKCAVPWMYLQMISIIDQSVALAIRLAQRQKYDVYDKSIWYVPVSSVYLLLSTYFWMVVQAARKEWLNDSQICVEPVPRLADFVVPSTANVETKSPSFLSQNFSMFESPRPPILPK
ncbi:hypothetical protein KM043_004717 [Ampulex compressa]|nr:hypothetical protein KM043_004717 [Ampulex compressa]